MSNPFSHFWLFLYAVGDHTFTLAAGCVLTVVINLIEKYARHGKPLPLKADVAILLSFVFFACFQAWRDEYDKVSRLPANQPVQITNQVNVPPTQVIVEHDDGAKSSTPRSWLELGQFLPGMGMSTITPGQKLGINVYLLNKGPEPVDDVRNFENLMVVDATNSAGVEAQKVFKKDLQEAQRKDAHIKGLKGSAVGAGGSLFNTARSEVLTQADVDGLTKGTSRLYIQVWSKWTDRQGRTGTLDACWWYEGPLPQELGGKTFVIHSCN